MLTTKQAFTFAELMISLVVIAVITLILYPTISDLAPNNNKYLFKETYQTITMLVSDYINSPDKKEVPLTNATTLCQVFCERLNTSSIKNSNLDDLPTCAGCTTFTTSNGMRWAFKKDGDKGYALVDVNASNNNTDNGDFPDIPSSSPIFSEGNNNPWEKGSPANGKAKGIFYTNNTITQDTFLFQISKDGKVSPQGNVAIDHLKSDD